MPADEAPSLPGLCDQQFAGKFQIEGLVARGGFGEVFRATHTALGRPVALKVLRELPPSLSETARQAVLQSFLHEARTIARLSHPHIVQVLDFGVIDTPAGGAPWMALEWLDGDTLRDALQQRRSDQSVTAGGASDATPPRSARGCSPAECLALIGPLLEALAYAHAEGVAHRDVKPANVMLARSKLGATVKLLDFGVAKLMDESERAGSGDTQTRSTITAYSLPYAAPEQVGEVRTGPWTDVHALGLILIELLTGASPYDGRDRMEVHCSVLAPQRPTPARRGIDVGPWEAVLARAVALRPADRFAHAGELLDALRATLAPAEASYRATANTSARRATVRDPNAADTTAQRRPRRASPGDLAPDGRAAVTASDLVTTAGATTPRRPRGRFAPRLGLIAASLMLLCAAVYAARLGPGAQPRTAPHAVLEPVMPLAANAAAPPRAVATDARLEAPAREPALRAEAPAPRPADPPATTTRTSRRRRGDSRARARGRVVATTPAGGARAAPLPATLSAISHVAVE